MLPSKKRDAMNTIYSFCRITDDIVDDNNMSREQKQLKLDEWKNSLSNAFNKKSENELFAELNDCVEEFNIPQRPFFDLIDGMEMDLNKSRYSTFEELKEYCYKVASTVGLMTIPVFGFKNKLTKEYAINLGIALQLTNILRDIKTDAQSGRIYLPAEDLERFNYSEQELLTNTYNENFIELMKFQSERAREFYQHANNNLFPEDKSSMFTARSMQYIYYRLLDKIEQEHFNVFEDKIRVSTFNKLFISLSVWIKYKLFT